MDENPKLLGNFEKILKFFDENSIEKLNFLFFFILIFFSFENLLLKIELSEITPFFYNNFFGFGGGDFPPFPPWLRPWVDALSMNLLYHNCLTMHGNEKFLYRLGKILRTRKQSFLGCRIFLRRFGQLYVEMEVDQ